MANFRTHISFGLAAGILGVIVIFGAAISHAPGFLIAVFVAVTLGSVLPDIDSDSGIPFSVAFGTLTVVASALTFSSVHKASGGSLIQDTVWAAVVGLFVWFVVGTVFKRITHHRGMAHSIPAAVLAGLCTFFLASRYAFTDAESFILASGMVGGFLIHLILDEIYAAVNFHGTTHMPNKAFGTALKFLSHSKFVNLTIYGTIIFLAAGNTQRLWHLAVNFWQIISGR